MELYKLIGLSSDKNKNNEIHGKIKLTKRIDCFLDMNKLTQK